MILRTNISDVALRLSEKIKAFSDDKVAREVAETTMGNMKVRIHQDGLDSSGNPIGTYTPGYMRVRTGKFLTNSEYKKGKNKGQIKPTGVFTKGKNKGQERPRYNRSDDTKVIISLRGASGIGGGLESGYSIEPYENGWGIALNKEEHYAESQFVENTYKKKIFSLTPDEEERAHKIVVNYVDKILQGK